MVADTSSVSVLCAKYPFGPWPKSAVKENPACSSRNLCLSVAFLILTKHREDVTNLQSQNRHQAILGRRLSKPYQIVLASSIDISSSLVAAQTKLR